VTTISIRRETVDHAAGGNATVHGAARWLSLAAAPTFAGMALLTGALEGGGAAVLCAQEASPLGGMALMYGLMSAFHAAPWLKLIASTSQRQVHRQIVRPHVESRTEPGEDRCKNLSSSAVRRTFRRRPPRCSPC
jgi:hypothetical protein